jgi:putative phosphoribosyl transferase
MPCRDQIVDLPILLSYIMLYHGMPLCVSDLRFKKDQELVDTTSETNNNERPVQVPAGAVILVGFLSIPEGARGIILFADATKSDQYKYTARLVREGGIATLLVNLLTPEDEVLDSETGFFRDNVDVQHQRIIGIANWLNEDQHTQNLRICYFGTGVSGAAALVAAAERPDLPISVVSVAARLDLAKDYLSKVEAPTLLLASENDTSSVNMNREGLEQLHGDKQLETISGTTNLFEQDNAQQEVARLAIQWFERHLGLG